MAIEDFGRWIENAQGPWLEELEKIKEAPLEIECRFGGELGFGTAGLRGILGSGSNRMNIYTVGLATQAFAEVLLEKKEKNQVAIAYDSRHGSRLFAATAAEVFAANGIKVYLFNRLMPTPTLSFAVRHLGCDAGVMVTASHNPAQYNGYKAYGSDGGQLTPAAADKIAEKMAKLDCFADVKTMPLEEAEQKKLVETISEEVVHQYLEAVYRLSLNKDREANGRLKVAYTPLNGAGLECVTCMMEEQGFYEMMGVEGQLVPDGNFSTCPTPNPELREAMELGIEESLKNGAELLVATDPDCDRIGVWVADRAGDGVLLTGNEIGVLLLDYICKMRSQAGTMPEHPLVVKSIVSADLADKIACRYGAEVRTVLTGFKYIGELLTDLEAQGREESFLFGFEESHGYLSGTHVRDKDGVNAAMLVCEMAAVYKKEGKSLLERLEELYKEYGYLCSRVVNKMFTGMYPMAEMAAVMEKLRTMPPARLGGETVSCYGDYLKGEILQEGEAYETGLDKTNMLRYQLGEKGWAVVRPSGTEPKMKIYLNFWGESRQQARALADRVLEDIQARIGE